MSAAIPFALSNIIYFHIEEISVIFLFSRNNYLKFLYNK